ncbi:hypothetical protein TNCV_3527601 [Trichonephila clavipes]|nr:hypothetical protein TNCV_3527601 [Trichonephila clavipes]
MTPELASPSPNYHTTPMGGHFSYRQIYRPTRWVFSGTGLEFVTKPATIRYLYHSATVATLERPGLRKSFLIGGLEGAKGCVYGDFFGDIRCDGNFCRNSLLSNGSQSVVYGPLGGPLRLCRGLRSLTCNVEVPPFADIERPLGKIERRAILD